MRYILAVVLGAIAGICFYFAEKEIKKNDK